MTYKRHSESEKEKEEERERKNYIIKSYYIA
jgi:hypothetical protein